MNQDQVNAIIGLQRVLRGAALDLEPLIDSDSADFVAGEVSGLSFAIAQAVAEVESVLVGG